jgi:hypothetical protein
MAGGFRARISLADSRDSMVTRGLTIRVRPVLAPRASRRSDADMTTIRR